MIGDIAKIFLESFLSNIFEGAKDYFKDLFGKDYKKNEQECRSTLELHFGEVVNWSDRLEFIGLESSKSIPNETIQLSIANKIRQFNKQKGAYISEEFILLNNENYLIIGDPGAGKTTTLKRLTQKFLFGDINSYQRFPVLIRLKEIKYNNLLTKIADTLGIFYEKRNIEPDEKEPPKYKYYVGHQLLENAIPAFLNSIKDLLILDGYDEIDYKKKESAKNEITLLSRKSSNFKILVTSRYGENFNQIEHFIFCEIRELDKKQLTQIISIWCDNPSKFIRIINKKAYKEIFNRPLFLNFLILHFNKLGYLPNTTHEVIRQIIYLLLDEWNQFQGVKRQSRYANFFSSQKFNFLSEIAYCLSIESNIKQFRHNDLLTIFEQILYKYGLKPKSSVAIAKEIESHTGIIIELHNKVYEFSHLVLQEYLAAEYIIKQPFSNNIFKLFQSYPSILAVATCISTDNGKYFANLFLNTSFSLEKYDTKDSTIIYLERLKSEDIYFTISAELGISFLYLFNEYSFSNDILAWLDNYTNQNTVMLSILKAIAIYDYTDKISKNKIIQLKRKSTYSVEQDISVPEIVAIPQYLKRRLPSLSNKSIGKNQLKKEANRPTSGRKKN